MTDNGANEGRSKGRTFDDVWVLLVLRPEVSTESHELDGSLYRIPGDPNLFVSKT